MNAFKVSYCLFILFLKNGSVRRWVACVADTLSLLYRRTTAISRKVVRKKVHATIPKGNMGYDQYTVPTL